MTRPVALLTALIVIALTVFRNQIGAQGAQGWPQWGGPGRNFHVESASIARAWRDGGPTELWRRPVGEGYSSILVQDSTLVTMYRRGNAEVIIALDAATGATRWEHAYDAPIAHNGYFDVWLNAAGAGPYSTPLIADNTVFAVGVNGQFHALDLRTGARRWSHDLVALFKLHEYNAFASSPLAYAGNVLLPLGGSGRGVVSLTRDTGAVLWQSDPIALGPGSPILIDVNGRKELVVWGQQEIVAIDPDNGRIEWRHPHAAQYGLNISTPVWGPDNRLFVSSAYGGGSRMLRVSRVGGRTTATELWANNRMRLHFGTALRMGNVVVGSSGDFGPAFMMAVNAETGTELWRDRSFARAQMIDANGMLVIVDENGDLALASMTDQGLRVHARKAILASNAWTPPTLVGATLYLRDRKDILALDLSK